MTSAELLITGRIASLASDDPEAFDWVEALAVSGGRVVASGSVTSLDGRVGPSTRRLELGPDEVAVPGLTDSHLHLAETALADSRVDLHDAASLDEGLARIAAQAAISADDRWIEGAGWDADRWGTWPTADALERAAPGRRVALWAHDHHALWASRSGFRAAGLGRSTPDPAGGVIRRDASGEPAGVLHEAAARLVTAHVPLAGAAEVLRAVEALLPRILATGVVALHDPGGLSLDPSLDRAIAAYRSLAADGRLGIRVHACVRPEQLDAALDAGLRSGEPLGDDPLDRLRVGWLKCFADGTLGSRTAALLDPLEPQAGDDPPPNDGFGVWMTEPAELDELARRAAAGGIATIIHAIGDAAVHAALDVLAPTVGRTSLTPRLEHVQLVADADMPRFASSRVAASVQPIHVRSDAAKARRLWGARAETRGYPFGRLARSGALVCFGTDAPVEPFTPWPGIACAVTRAAPDWPAGSAAFGPQDAMSLARALRAATIAPAIAAGERDRGRLVAGHRADLVVLPGAALSEPVEVGGALWHAKPRLVLLDGQVAFEA